MRIGVMKLAPLLLSLCVALPLTAAADVETIDYNTKAVNINKGTYLQIENAQTSIPSDATGATLARLHIHADNAVTQQHTASIKLVDTTDPTRVVVMAETSKTQPAVGATAEHVHIEATTLKLKYALDPTHTYAYVAQTVGSDGQQYVNLVQTNVKVTQGKGDSSLPAVPPKAQAVATPPAVVTPTPVPTTPAPTPAPTPSPTPAPSQPDPSPVQSSPPGQTTTPVQSTPIASTPAPVLQSPPSVPVTPITPSPSQGDAGSGSSSRVGGSVATSPSTGSVSARPGSTPTQQFSTQPSQQLGTPYSSSPTAQSSFWTNYYAAASEASTLHSTVSVAATLTMTALLAAAF